MSIDSKEKLLMTHRIILRPRLYSFSSPKHICLLLFAAALAAWVCAAQTPLAQIHVALDQPLGPMAIDHFALGQGGLSHDPMWEERAAEIRALHPRVIRLFVQELSKPPADARVQPCFIAEVAWQMKEAGLDYSCYYHIRDYHVSINQFAPFMSAQGAAFMAKWWNRTPQFDGLFDFQNTIRPAYFTFKLLARLTGQRLQLTSDHPSVHGFATLDAQFRNYNLLVWNFSPVPLRAEITLRGVPRRLTGKGLLLDANAPSSDENSRLRPVDPFEITKEKPSLEASFDPYGIRFWALEEHP